MSERVDVVAVTIDGGTVRMLYTDQTQANADAIVKMAVMRRGVEEEFFATAPVGKYHDGDHWSPPQ